MRAQAIKKNEGMVVLINAFIGTLQPIGYVVMYTLFTYAVFALLGMSFFGGRFYSCSTPGAEYPGGKCLCSGSHALEASNTVYMVPRCWDNPRFHFDDLSTSLLTVYRLGTMKYIDIMNTGMDVTSIDQSPKQFFSAEFAMFFVGFIILGGFFVINIVVAFTVDGINVNQGRTDADFRFNEVMNFVRQITNSDNGIAPASNIISTMLRKVLDSKFFGAFSAMCIAVNAVFMLTDHADSSTRYQAMMDTQNDIFFAELAAEVVLRFIADGPRHFFSRKWNIFDALVACGLGLTYVGGFVEFGQFAKGFRLVRLIRLILFIRPVRIVFDTLLVSMPQLINVAGVLFLAMFTSASLGVALYSETKFQAKLGPAANFRTFPEALKVIYQIFTGEEWQALMAECSIQPPFCTKTFDGYSFGDCGYELVTPIFFIGMKVLCELMILNLLVGSILDNLNVIMNSIDHVESDDWQNGASFNQINDVAMDFKRFSSNTNKISLTCIRPLLHTMKQPLGFRNKKGDLIMDTHVSPPHAHSNLIILCVVSVVFPPWSCCSCMHL
jgi:hypothetical protein